MKKNVDIFQEIVKINANGTKIPCFQKGNVNSVLSEFKDRFHFHKDEQELIKLVDNWIDESNDNWRTNYYDKFQLLTNDIKP